MLSRLREGRWLSLPSLGGMRTISGVTQTFNCFTPKSSEGEGEGLHVCMKCPGSQLLLGKTGSCNANESQ